MCFFFIVIAWITIQCSSLKTTFQGIHPINMMSQEPTGDMSKAQIFKVKQPLLFYGLLLRRGYLFFVTHISLILTGVIV